MKFKITKIAGKLPVTLYSYLQTFFYSVWRFHITAKRALVFLCVFRFVCFRSRSHPVPHRGERVKQGMVHPRNVVIITSKIFL